MNRRFIEIKKWLLDNGLTQKAIADEAGVTGPAVSHVCRGIVANSKIKEVLLKHGCPRELLEGRIA